MAVLKHFDCIHCEAEGKINVKGNEINVSDIVYCPVCGGDIYEEEFDAELED